MVRFQSQEIHKKNPEYSAGSVKKELKTNKMEERQRRKSQPWELMF
ncbi:hypothetical protein LEMLEM_LOCUS25026, partial [Lemmus lemmus]